MTNPLKTQQGGQHYKGMAIQPFQLAMANNYDSLVHSAIKYVHRHPLKGGYGDLLKAIHMFQLRGVLAKHTPAALNVIPIESYIHANEIPEPEAVIIRLTHSLAVKRPDVSKTMMTVDIIRRLKRLAELRYPDEDRIL